MALDTGCLIEHEVPIRPSSDNVPGVRQWLGVSHGRWDGETLVVDTRNFDARVHLFGSGANRRVVERFTRRGERDIEYAFTVHDPSVWIHYSMPLILRGARARERAEASTSDGR